MWNPLTLPFAAIGIVAGAPRAVSRLARVGDMIEEGLVQLTALNDHAVEGQRLLAASVERVEELNARGEVVMDRVDRLSDQGERMLVEIAEARRTFDAAMERVDRLTEQGDRVLAELADAERLVERLMSGGDDLSAASERMREQAVAMIETVETTRPTVERIADSAHPMIDAAREAREQLAITHDELTRANAQIARALELAGPLETVTARVERIAGRVRRDPRPGRNDADE